MTRLFTRTLHLCIFFFALTSAFAAIEPIHNKIQLKNVDICDAPPPDSFRITKIGVDFISLAWNPAWPGTEHQLDVFMENNAGGWDSLFTVNIASAASKTVDNLESGKKYGFKIRTKCNNGDPSVLSAFIDGITVIIELTLNGRTPVNPTPVNCQGISLVDPKNEWIGYRILWEKSGKVFSSLFEFEVDGGDVAGNSNNTKQRIKRVEVDNPVVAANELTVWPDLSFPVVDVFFQIIMGELSSDGTNFYPIGNVNVAYDPTLGLVDICNDTKKYWNPYYRFEAIVDQKVIGEYSQNNQFRTLENAPPKQIVVQSPFGDILTLFIPDKIIEQESFYLRLINQNGQVVFDRTVETLEREVVLQVGSIAPGLYVVRLEFDDCVQIIKTIKFE